MSKYVPNTKLNDINNNSEDNVNDSISFYINNNAVVINEWTCHDLAEKSYKLRSEIEQDSASI